jgi:hypothetical protein
MRVLGPGAFCIGPGQAGAGRGEVALQLLEPGQQHPAVLQQERPQVLLHLSVFPLHTPPDDHDPYRSLEFLHALQLVVDIPAAAQGRCSQSLQLIPSDR